MSGQHRHHGGGSGGRINLVGGVPAAPPPPVLSSGRQGRNVGRHSRSRSPRNFNRSRSNNTRFSRQGHDPHPPERGRRQIRQSRSPSPFAGASANNSADLYRSSKGSGSMMSHSLSNHHNPLPSGKSQSISLITGEGSLPIIRRILDPDSVKIPRRSGEGGRPIFDREELKEGLRRRFAADDDDGRGGRIPSPTIPQPSQRVIAIIREPTLDSYRLPSSSSNKGIMDRSGRGYSGVLSSSREAQPTHQHRDFRDRQRSISPPTRDRDLRERPRERPSLAATSSVQLQRSGGDRRGGAVEEDSRIRSADRDRVPRERVQQQTARPNRSPVRILRERPSRSHSRTPPPMPAEIRRQMIERQRDLRSKLSRPAGRFAGGKFDANSADFRGGDSGFRGGRGGVGGGFVRGRGGFRGRDDGRSAGRGPWEHDLFERDGVDGELKSKS